MVCVYELHTGSLDVHNHERWTMNQQYKKKQNEKRWNIELIARMMDAKIWNLIPHSTESLEISDLWDQLIAPSP